MTSALQKIELPGRTNAICWNPMEPSYFTCANEDHNLYTFDMRFMKSAHGIHRDFLSSVMSVDYSPTGREFVAGGYDMTMRIFERSKGTSREVYFTRRMNRVFR
jgi:WD repeat and SOF domain-containing protein 1